MLIYTFPNTRNRYTFSGPIEVKYEIPNIVPDQENPTKLWGVPASHPYFLVSNYGDIIINKDFKHPAIQICAEPEPFNINGYKYVCEAPILTEKRSNTAVHRLVAEVFVENPFHKPFVNHIDGNRSNNIWFNLEWVTQKENLLHGRRAGRIREPLQTVTRDRDTGFYSCYISELKSAEDFNNRHRIGRRIFFPDKNSGKEFLDLVEHLRNKDLGEEKLIENLEKLADIARLKLEFFLREKESATLIKPVSEKQIKKRIPMLPSDKAEAIELQVFSRTEENRKKHFIDESFRDQLIGI